MQVRELVEVGRFLREIIQEKQLPQLYEQLINAVNQAAQNQNPEAVRKFLDQLVTLHREAESKVLSPAQSRLLSEFGAAPLLGEQAADRLTRIFADNQAHPQGLVAGLQQMRDETTALVKRANQMVSFLEPMLVELDEADLAEDEGRLWLYFADAASVETIEDLETAAETWKQVLHHFSRMPDADAKSGRILQIHKYSPLELELAASVAVLVPLALGIQWVLSRIEHVIRILQEAEHLKQLKVKTEIVEALKTEADEKRKEIAREAANDLKKRFKANNEARNAAEHALKSVIRFIEGGGQLDIDVTAPEEKEAEEGQAPAEPPDRAELRRLVAAIRESIKLLPPPAEPESPND